MSYLLPSSAPTVTSRKARQPQRRTTQSRQPRAIEFLRPISPQAKTALSAHRAVVNAVSTANRQINPPKDDGGMFSFITSPAHVFGNIAGNAIREVGQIIPGSSRLAFETVKNLGQAATGAIPGVPWSSKPAVRNLTTLGKGVVKGVGTDIGYVAGPILRGDFKTLGHRVAKEPVRTIGALALLYGGAGGAVRAGSEAGAAAARLGGAAKTAERLSAFASKKTGAGSRRYRAPEVIGPPSVDQYGRAVMPAEAGNVTRNLRPRSSNIITREIQRAVTDKAAAKIKESLGKVSISSRGKITNPLAPVNRYRRLVAKDTRNRGAILTATLENDFIRGSKQFQSVVRAVPKELGGKKLARAAHYTAALRAMGLNNLAKTHTSRTWGRDKLISLYENASRENPVHAADIQRNIDALKSIPDHWLDPATAPKIVNDLTKQTVDVLEKSTELKIKTGLLSPETVAFSARRSQLTVAGVLPQYKLMVDAQKAQQEAAATAAVISGKISGLTDEVARIETSAKASKKPMSADVKQALEETKGQIAALEKERKAAADLAAKNASEASRLHTYIGGIIDWEMSPGSYFPHRESIQPGLPGRRRLEGRPTGPASSRMTMARENENMGVLLRRGTAAFGPDVTLAAFRNALDLYGRQRAVESIVTKYVVRGPDGNPITDAAAIELAKHSNNLYVVKSTRELVRTLASNDMSTAAEELLNAVKKVDDTKYLIPRSVVTGWSQALGAPKTVFDAINAYWKAGVLALSPRWYMQNMVGMWSQFALGAGLDLQAIKMAASPKYRDAVIAEIEGHGLTSDLGEFVRREGGAEPRGRLRRVVEFGYKWNSRFESVPRRAMYFNAVKKRLREEEIVSKSANSAELSDAWLNVVNAAKRDEAWANHLMDQVITETERFMGDYLKYNQFERTFLRRAFPFYGWIRAIHRLAFALPFKYPKRTALLMAASRVANQMYSDNESMLLDPIAGLVVGKNLFLGTGGTNPFETTTSTFRGLGEIAKDVSTGDFSNIPSAVIQQVYPQLNPILTDPATVALGVTPLGTPLKYGYGNDVYTDPRTGRSLTIDPVTGQVVDAKDQIGLEQMVGRNFPLYNLTKRVIAGATPTDTASIGDLLAWKLRGSPAKDAPNLVVSANPQGQALSKGRLYDWTSALFGLPLYRYSPRNALIESLRKDQMYMDAFKANANKALQARALYETIGAKP